MIRGEPTKVTKTTVGHYRATPLFDDVFYFWQMYLEEQYINNQDASLAQFARWLHQEVSR